MKTMRPSSVPGRFHIVVAGALSTAGLAACTDVDFEDHESEEIPLPQGDRVVGEFEVRLRPSVGELAIVQKSRDASEGLGLSPESQRELPILQDQIPGSGPADTVELVTNSVNLGAGCPAPYQTASFCGNVTLRHFFQNQGFNNVYVQVTAIMDQLGRPLSGHCAKNSDPAALGLDNSLGLWRYTASGYNPLSGILGKAVTGATDNAATRDWVFDNPNNANTIIWLRVVASSTYANYTRTGSTTAVNFIDACGLPGANTSTSTPPITGVPLPFPFTLYGGGDSTSYGLTSTKVSYSFKGEISLGDTPLQGGSNLSLPSTSAPKPAIFPFWDDLAYNANGKLCSGVSGTAPNRIFVITWNDMKFATDAANTTSLIFSAYLYEGSDKIEFVYKNMTSLSQQVRANGNSATIGMQDATGTVATPNSISGGTFVSADGSTMRSFVFTPFF
jgi:hypothetical protein